MEAAYEFGPFRVDPEKRLLSRDGVLLSLPPKAFDMLLVLLQHTGEVVSKDALMEALWPDSHVDEANLTQTVFLLRKAFGESASDPRFIVTVAGRGYRFSREVRMVTAQSAPPDAVAETSAVPKRRWMVALIAAAILAAILISLYSLRRGTMAATNAPIRLAVLPFENLTGDAAQDYFSDGLTEEVTLQLQRQDPQRIEVLARVSAPAGTTGRDQLKKIGREVNVTYLVEGAVRRDGDQVRASAKLVRALDQTYVWTREYDRRLTNLLALESEIAQDIAQQVRLVVGGVEGKPRVVPPTSYPANFAAHDSYLKGRYLWNKRTAEGLHQAIAYFEQATEQDPRYALAYAGMADCYALDNGYTLRPASQSMPKARQAALRAVAIDPDLAEAHTSLAVIAQNYDYDWKTAEAEYRRAIELNPNYATAHHWYAEFLGLQGRFDEASSEMERARRLEPLSVIMAADNAAILYYSRQFDRSIDQFRLVLDIEPNFGRADMVIYPYVQKHRYDEALAFIDKCCESEESIRHWSQLAYVYGKAGAIPKARDPMVKLKMLYAGKDLDRIPLVWAEIGIGDYDTALADLKTTFAARSSNLTNLKVNPLYDPVRSDARFQAVFSQMGFGQ